MENLFIGFRVNGHLYGAKSYIGNDKEWTKSYEMVSGFFERNNLEDMNNVFNSISWEKVGNSKRINNGFILMSLLKEDTVEKFAYYRREVNKKIDNKGAKNVPLYDPSRFEEKDGHMLVLIKNHGEIYNEYHFEKSYIIDLDKDELIIEDHENNQKETIQR